MPYADTRAQRESQRNSARRRQAIRRSDSRDRKPFVNWDGEGYSAWVVDGRGTCEPNRHFYILFGNSDGAKITGPNLGTIEIFEFILEISERTAGHVINISYAFDYDVNMILGELSERHIRRLRQAGHCYWRGYRIEHRPHKWLQLSRRDTGSGRRSIRIYDGFSFFACGFVEACAKYVGRSKLLEQVREGKSRRAKFSYADLAYITTYWTLEHQLAVELWNALRLSITSAGIHISGWHGPGAIATALFQAHGLKQYMDKELPKEIIEASRYAYSSGRFEPFRGGYYAPESDSSGVFHPRVWIADIHNAYPYAASRLPSLKNGSWIHLGASDAAREAKRSHRLALYRIRLEGDQHDYTKSSLQAMPMPLFYRNQGNRISYPVRVEGWFHSSDAAGALFLFRERCHVSEAWIFDDDGSSPLSWLEEIYYERMAKPPDDPGRLALKLGPNAAYGKIAQRVGWNEETRQAPPFHQLEWAGAITSRCREMVLQAMLASNRHSGLVSCDTDGIISTTPFTDKDLPNGIGPGLGQWEVTEYSGILYYQNGVYWLRDLDGNWLTPKARGIPKSQLEFSRGMEALRSGNPLHATQHQFIGYGAALRGRMDEWRTWIDHPREFIFGGGGKRIHNPSFCLECHPQEYARKLGDENRGLHNFILRDPGGGASIPHNLPWIEDDIDDPDNPFNEKRWTILDEELF